MQVENQSSSECVTVAAEEEDISEVRQVKTVDLPEEEASAVEVESEIEVPLSYTFYWHLVPLLHTLFRTLHPF